MRKGPLGWIASGWRFVFDVGKRWYYGRVGDLAASVTFWLLISLPATVLALLAALGPVDRLFSFVTKRLGVNDLELQSQMRSEVLGFISRVLTDEGGEIGETVSSLFEQSSPGLLTFSVALTLWSISRGFAGLIRALEDIYDIEPDNRRPWYIARVVAVGLGIGSVLVPVPLVALDQLVWNELGDGAGWSAIRILILVTVLILWASIVYHFGPATRHRWKFDLPGAVVAALLWWLLSIGFARYVDLFTGAEGADEVRAAVGAFLLALTWVWMAAQVLLIGGAVNFLFGERLGVTRDRREWSIPDVVSKSTGELKRIMTSGPGNGETAKGEGGSVGGNGKMNGSGGAANGRRNSPPSTNDPKSKKRST